MSEERPTETLTEQKQPLNEPVVIRVRSRAWIGATVVLVVLFVCATVFGLLWLPNPRKLQDGIAGGVSGAVRTIADGFRPEVVVKTVHAGLWEKLEGDSKLVVMTLYLNAQVHKTSSKRILWDYLSLGDTETDVRVNGCKVQYFLPLESLSEKAFGFAADEKKLKLSIPKPFLDKELVDIPSDPEKWEVNTEVGWGRLRSFSGEHVEELARKEIRSVVVDEGERSLYLEKAEQEAKRVMEELIKPILAPFGPEVTVEIQFI